MQKILLLVALFACATYASICHSWGDPHNQLLNGQRYDLYRTQGDFNFFQYKNILVQERVSNSRTWGTNSLLIGAAVRVGRKTFEILHNITRINKKIVNAAQLKAAGVKITGNVYTITTQGITIKIHNHQANDAISGRNYLSLYVDVPAALQRSAGKQMRGLCVTNDSGRYAVRKAKRSLFATKPKYVTLPPRPRRQFTAAQTNAARAACLKTGLKARGNLNNCVFDYLRAKNKQAVLRAYAGDHKDNVALRKIDAKQNKKFNAKKCKRTVRKLKRSVRRLKRQLNRAIRAKRNAENRARNLSNQNISLRNQVNNLSARLRNSENRVRTLSNQLNATRRSLNNAIAARRNAERRAALLRSQLNAANRRCEIRVRNLDNNYRNQIARLNKNYQNSYRQQQQNFQRQFDEMRSYYQRLVAQLQRRK